MYRELPAAETADRVLKNPTRHVTGNAFVTPMLVGISFGSQTSLRASTRIIIERTGSFRACFEARL